MNKIIIVISILVCIFTIQNVEAKVINSSDISPSTYVIGKYMYTRNTSSSMKYDGKLTTKRIMLAARTISGNDEENMIIYYKTANGIWIDALTGEKIEVPDYFNIEVSDLVVKENETTYNPNYKEYVFNNDKIENSSYVIGNYLYTRNINYNNGYDGKLTTKRIMLASKTINKKSESDMIIYYKTARGTWIDALTGNTVTAPKECKIGVVDLITQEPANIITSFGYDEGLAVEIEDNDYTKTKFYYSQDKINWAEVDRPLIRKMTDNKVRIDVLGLKSGKYYVKAIDSKKREIITDLLNVSAYDRSGYAHFNYNKGVGAYNDDGTLKKDAVVLYVTEKTKNTIELEIDGVKYKGLVRILENIGKFDKPFVLRVIGKIRAPQPDYVEWKEKSNLVEHIKEVHKLLNFQGKGKNGWNDKSQLTLDKMVELGIVTCSDCDKITKLDNLVYYAFPKYQTLDGVKYTTYDIHYNYISIEGASNVTIEGVGKNGELYQFGLRFSKANSIEVRNLKITEFPDRALIVSGDSANVSQYGNYWIHNNTFNAGKNNFDVRPSYGSNYAYENAYHPDETLGFGGSHDITSSYNVFNKSYKAYLINDNATASTNNITLHHNYYNEVMQRTPRIRKANVHSYNNYYYKIRQMSYVVDMNAIVFSENNYYDIKEENSSYGYMSVFRINWHNDDDSDEHTANSKVKSYGDYFSCDENSENLGNNYCIARVYTDTKESVGPANLNLSHVFIANTRDERKLNTVNYLDLVNNYSHFDTDEKLFYYDKVNKVSKVSNLLPAKDVKDYCIEHSGVLKK